MAVVSLERATVPLESFLIIESHSMGILWEYGVLFMGFYGNLCYFCIKSCVIVMLDRLLDSMDPKSKNLKFELFSF